MGYKIVWAIDMLSHHEISQSQTWQTRHCYPNMLCTNKISQHAIGQLEAREARHTIPACIGLDKLSQHAVSQLKTREARHAIQACSGSQSQIGKLDTTIPAYTARINLSKRGCKSPEQWTSRHSETAVPLEKLEQEEQQSKQLQHLGRLGKRHEA